MPGPRQAASKGTGSACRTPGQAHRGAGRHAGAGQHRRARARRRPCGCRTTDGRSRGRAGADRRRRRGLPRHGPAGCCTASPRRWTRPPTGSRRWQLMSGRTARTSSCSTCSCRASTARAAAAHGRGRGAAEGGGGGGDGGARARPRRGIPVLSKHGRCSREHAAPGPCCEATGAGPWRMSRSARVLVVDDTPTKRYILSSWLRRAGHRVVEAAGGEEALAVLREQRPDLVDPGRTAARHQRLRGVRADQGESGDGLDPGHPGVGQRHHRGRSHRRAGARRRRLPGGADRAERVRRHGGGDAALLPGAPAGGGDGRTAGHAGRGDLADEPGRLLRAVAGRGRRGHGGHHGPPLGRAGGAGRRPDAQVTAPAPASPPSARAPLPTCWTGCAGSSWATPPEPRCSPSRPATGSR